MTECPILVVDDDPSIRAIVAEILTGEGYPVATARNGAEALALVERTIPAFAVILLDMRMPVLDGWGVARALQERGVAVPLLAMTAAQNAGRWAREIGAAGHVAKPFDLPELLAEVERLCPPPTGHAWPDTGDAGA